MMNHQQHTSLSLSLIPYVKRALAEEDVRDSVLAGRVEEYINVAKEYGIAVDDQASDSMVDGQILTLCSNLIDSHPESAAVLLAHIAHRQITNWQFRQPLYSLYHNLMSKIPTTRIMVDSLLTFMDAEILSPLKVNAANRQDAMLFLLVNAHEALLNTKSAETSMAMPGFIELAAISFRAQDHVGATLTSGIYNITKASAYPDEIEGVQQTIDEALDPLLRLFCACAPHGPIFGPSLEDMLVDMVKLKETHQSLQVHAVRPLRGDVVNPQKISELILSALTLKASMLSAEMNLPQQSGFYPLGWSFTANFPKHPVIESLNTLMPWLETVTSEDAVIARDHDLLRTRAKTNMVACLANWCGHEARPGPEATHRAVSAIILNSVFDKSYLKDALKRVDEKGMQSLTDYVMDNHRALGRHLPRAQKGEYLSDSLGL